MEGNKMLYESLIHVVKNWHEFSGFNPHNLFILRFYRSGRYESSWANIKCQHLISNVSILEAPASK